jgi:lysophospholipase L1-like esterase
LGTVSFESPIVTGGSPPVSSSCTPPSGSTFSVGSSSVTCTATDDVHRTASCSFTVTVNPPPLPQLSVTTILAFGDSITEGEIPAFRESGSHPRHLAPDFAYPAQLETLLGQRYTAQGISRLDATCSTDPAPPPTRGLLVINTGCTGERAGGPGTRARLDDKLVTYHPDVVLLLEGVNDLAGPADIPGTVQALGGLIAAARVRGARVLAGTLLPQIAGHAGAAAASLIVPFNTQFVPAAQDAGALVVDLYSPISADVSDWISPIDGLHPTEAGYGEIARVFFDRIRSAFEVTASSSTSATPNGRSSGKARRNSISVVRTQGGTAGPSR